MKYTLFIDELYRFTTKKISLRNSILSIHYIFIRISVGRKLIAKLL
jgi:hypothetical protein